MGYKKVYFRIHCDYSNSDGWHEQTARDAFRLEVRELFQGDGWQYRSSETGGGCATVVKGWQDLYLHPMSFSGVVQTEDIPHLQELFSKAKTFRCYGVDQYEEFFDLSDERYLALLESRQDEIVDVILERYRTRRRNLYVASQTALGIAAKFSVHRLCDKDGKKDLAIRYVGELIERMVQDGRLLRARTRSGDGLRTATEKELRQREKEEKARGKAAISAHEDNQGALTYDKNCE